ncbi:hypothetical protein LCGC14_2788420 [marine sediment metagenome]|uniref:C2H2-type domain-containing protein n=1 Tax=marine sediment metagenome TaxID=412755 RepID=A0A0F8ZDD5_9ZZZZ
MRQGGESFKGTKKGVRSIFKCGSCSRNYKMEHNRDTHEKSCREFNKNPDKVFKKCN